VNAPGPGDHPDDDGTAVAPPVRMRYPTGTGGATAIISRQHV